MLKLAKIKSNVENKEETVTDKNKTSCYLVTISHFSPDSPIDESTLRFRNYVGLLPLPISISLVVTIEPPASHLHELHDHNTRQMTINNYNYQSVAESHK